MFIYPRNTEELSRTRYKLSVHQDQIRIWSVVFCKPRCIWIFAVPSENKRDVRSIEETLNDIRKRKKFRSDDVDDENDED